MAASASSSIYELRDSNRVGRSLFATKSIPFGTLILSDSNILFKFSAEDLTPLNELLKFDDSDNCKDAKEFISRYKSLPALTLSAVAVINQTISKVQQEQQQKIKIQQIWKHVKDMHCPPLPISSDTFLMYQSCEKLLELKQKQIENSSPSSINVCSEIATLWNQNEQEANNNASLLLSTATTAILHAVMALKTNAHRSTDNDWCLYPLASKLAHSCDPNCYFIPPSPANNFTASFISTKRTIEKGEVLSFSYLGGPPLTLSTNQRRRRLLRSHLFVCKCTRCEETEDLSSCVSDDGGNSVYVRLSCPLGLIDADFNSDSASTGKQLLWRKLSSFLTSNNKSTSNQSFLSDSQLFQQIPSAASLFNSEDDKKYNPQVVFAQDNEEKKNVKVKYSAIVSALKSLVTEEVTTSSPHLQFAVSSNESKNPRKALLHRRIFLSQPLVCEACRHAVSYFTSMCQLSIRATNSGLVPKNKPKVTPFQLLFCWTLKYFSCLESMGILNKNIVKQRDSSSSSTFAELDDAESSFNQTARIRLCDPPHMLVAQTAVTLIDLCLQHPPPPKDGSTNNNNTNEVILVPDATPATGILAVLAQHCRPFVAAAASVSSSSSSSTDTTAADANQQQQQKKLEKFELLCDLEPETFEAIREAPLMTCLEMSCADELWKWMAFGNESTACKTKGIFDPKNEFKSLFDGWDA